MRLKFDVLSKVEDILQGRYFQDPAVSIPSFNKLSMFIRGTMIDEHDLKCERSKSPCSDLAHYSGPDH